MQAQEFIQRVQRDILSAGVLIALVITTNFFFTVYIAVNITMIALPIAYIYKSAISDSVGFMLNGGVQRLEEYARRQEVLDENERAEYTSLCRINRLVEPVLSRLPKEAKEYYTATNKSE